VGLKLAAPHWGGAGRARRPRGPGAPRARRRLGTQYARLRFKAAVTDHAWKTSIPSEGPNRGRWPSNASGKSILSRAVSTCLGIGRKEQNHDRKKNAVKLKRKWRRIGVPCRTRELLDLRLRENLNITGPHVGCDHLACAGLHGDMNGKVREIAPCSWHRPNVQRSPRLKGARQSCSAAVLQKFPRASWSAKRFCTPGMITRASKLWKKTPTPHEEEVPVWNWAAEYLPLHRLSDIVKSIRAAAK